MARPSRGPLGIRGWVHDPAGRFSWLKTATLILVLRPCVDYRAAGVQPLSLGPIMR